MQRIGTEQGLLTNYFLLVNLEYAGLNRFLYVKRTSTLLLQEYNT